MGGSTLAEAGFGVKGCGVETATEVMVWGATWSFVVLGVIGTLLPFLPGHLMIFLAALVPWLSLEDRGGLGWWTLATLGVGLVVSQVVEYLSGAIGSRWFGGSKWGALGAVIGGVVGIFVLFPFGLLLGPLVGAFAFEAGFAKKAFRPATVSGVGSAIGTVTGMVLKVVLAVLMAAYLVGDVVWF